jgi:hypothetical protein
MFSRPLNYSSFLSLLLLPLCAHAELQDGRYFQAIAADTSKVRTLWYQLDNEKQTVSATYTLRSSDYAYAEGETIIFYGERVDHKGKPIPEAVATIPSGATRLLLRFTKLATPDKRGLSYRVHTFKDDTKTFPFGSFHFVNASAKDVDVDIGGKAFHLKQDAMKNIAMQPPEKGDVSIEITAIQSKSRYTNGWGHHSNLRTLVFIVDGPNGRIKPLRYRQTAPSN